MSDERDEIDYSGPGKEYHIPPGGNYPQGPTPLPSGPSGLTYADPVRLEELLKAVDEMTDTVKKELETELVNKALPITSEDIKLREAHEIEWPKSLGTPKNSITYRYYRAIRNRGTTGANYISKRFEEANRDVTGTSALDIMKAVETIQDESKLVKEFSRTYVGNVDDSSEYRTIELFQDWAEAALEHATNFRKYFQQGVTPQISATEVDQASPAEARNAQAIFKVKLNNLNQEIERQQQHLQKNYSQFADVFYGKFLGPALQFRLNAGRKYFPPTGVLGSEVNAATDSMNKKLNQAQGDQLRRNMMFDTKMRGITDLLTERDTYRSYIQQLAIKGKSVPTGTAGILVEETDSDEELETWEDIESLPHATPSIIPDHDKLHGRENESAHDQYFLKRGGNLSGDVTLSPGVRVGGIIPSEHSHTGVDGSRKVKGYDIEGGSLTTDSINRNEAPPVPSDLRLLGTTSTLVPPGVAVIDAQIAWDGDPILGYEVQIVAVGTV
ncbi:MAG TPA: hypothetical protein VJ742_12340 [Nitrososphaera sp.]|nr:hypothetical protein [Nitrososphaera sp.]